jgi:triacylglycerol lipase
MNFDNSWDAVLKPGKATKYFDVLDKTKFEADATSYSKINAWWMAELCRLIYREETDEDKDAKPPTRQQVLDKVQIEEVEFFNEGGTEAALVKTKSSAAVQFAALVFRGTTDLQDWLINLKVFPKSWAGRGAIHDGFGEALKLVWDKVTASLDKNVPSDCPMFISGHSLGAALATLAASLRPPRGLYTFGSPRVGDNDFGATLSRVNVFRVVNNRDLVTTVPPPFPLHHVGELHYITHDGGMLVNPDDDTVARDRLKRDRLSFASLDLRKLFTDAPEIFADHAPVNYVAHLERQVE